MLHTSKAFDDAIKAPQREIYFRLKINDVWYEKDKLHSAEVSYGSSNEEFAIGTAYANSLKVVFSEVITDFSEMDEVDAELGVLIPNKENEVVLGVEWARNTSPEMTRTGHMLEWAEDRVEYYPLGTFVISEQVDVNRNDKITTINCLDNMILMEGEYVSDLSYPARIIDIAVEIANKSGMEVNQVSFARLSTRTISRIESATYRQAIAMIAQFEGGFAIFDREGKLDIRTLNNTNFEIRPAEYRSKGMTKNDLQYRLGGISAIVDDETTLQAGSTSGSQINLENSVMNQDLLNGIYNKLEDLNFYPFALEWWGNPALEYGDWVTLFDLEGNAFKAPVLKYSLSFNGGLSSSISANIEVTSPNTTAYRSPLEREIIAIMARISANGKNRIYDDVTEPDNPKENDIWFRPNGPDTDILIYKRNEKGELEWIEEVSTKTTRLLREAIEEAVQQVEENKQMAEQQIKEAKEEAERLVTEQDEIYQELFDGYDEAVSDLSLGLSEADKKAGDALVKAGESIDIALTASEGVARIESEVALINTKASDALGKADDAIVKANNIPASIDNVISAKGLVSGDWVNQRINDETGELYYALESVRGDIPDVILGVEWDRSGDPQMTRTDYVESYVNLDDYTMKMAEFNVSVDGLEMDLAQVRRDKLDSGVFTSFKTNEYANDINGIRQRLTNAEENKLDSGTFETFKEHDYQVTVNGLEGNINKLQRDKLNGDEFTSFKENDYRLTVDGFEMDLISMSGAIPSYVMGVEWDKSESPQMARTDYTEELDLTNQDAPDYIMGVEWNKEEDPAMVRTYDVTESPTKEEFELFLSEYSFRADGWDATNKYVTENSTAINSLINNAHGWQQTIGYVDANQTKFNETVSQVDFYKQTIGSNAENVAQLVMTDEAFVTRIGQLEGMAEDVIVGVEWDKSSSPEMARTGYMDDWIETQVVQLADSWSMNLKSNGDVVTAINATEDGVRILGKNIVLDGDTLVTGNFAVTGSHVILDANTQVRGDFTVSGGNVILNGDTTVLGSFTVSGRNVILDGNTTVHGDFSVFGKNIILDGDTTVTGNFTVAGDIVGSGIRADNITTGTLNAGQITVVNLDVSCLSGNISNFVQSAWNTAAGGSVSISGSGIVSTASTNAQTYIQNGVVGFRGPDGGGMGFIGYSQRNDHTHMTISLSNSRGFYLRYSNADGTYRPVLEYAHYNDQLQTGVGMSVGGGLRLNNNGITNTGSISGANQVEFSGSSGLITPASNGRMRYYAYSEMQFYLNNHRVFTMDRNHAGENNSLHMHGTLNMNSYNIINQSDERLKSNIINHKDSSLDKINEFNFVDFSWIKDGRADFGVIAQQVQQVAPELISEGADGYLSVNNSLLNMMTTHGLQELNNKHELVVSTVDSHTETIHTLQQELSEANRRIEELESRIA